MSGNGKKGMNTINSTSTVERPVRTRLRGRKQLAELPADPNQTDVQVTHSALALYSSVCVITAAFPVTAEVLDSCGFGTELSSF